MRWGFLFEMLFFIGMLNAHTHFSSKRHFPHFFTTFSHFIRAGSHFRGAGRHFTRAGSYFRRAGRHLMRVGNCFRGAGRHNNIGKTLTHTNKTAMHIHKMDKRFRKMVTSKNFSKKNDFALRIKDYFFTAHIHRSRNRARHPCFGGCLSNRYSVKTETSLPN